MVQGSNPCGRTNMTTLLPTQNWSDSQIMEAAMQIRIGYKLKRTIRYGSTRDPELHSESVADHIFALIYLAQYFLPIEDPEQLLDEAKVYTMILYHDFGEIAHGDIPYHQKTKADQDREAEDAIQTFAKLPAHMQTRAKALWQEYEDKQSPEARFVNALDKIEPSFELLDPVSSARLKEAKFTYDLHMTKKRIATEGFPIMRRFVEVIGDELLKRDVFWKE